MVTTLETYRPTANYGEALERACQLWGIQEQFWDIFGKLHVASADVRRSILASVGVSTNSLEELNAAIEERYWAEWSAVVTPTLVVSVSSTSAPATMPVQLRADQSSATIEVTFEWETGQTTVSQVQASTLQQVSQTSLRGQEYVRRLLLLPPEAPLGYHSIKVKVDSGSPAEARLILCPKEAYLPDWLKDDGKGAGIAVSLYGIRSATNWGCGDFTDLQNFSDWVAKETGASFVALNPLHSIPNRQPYNTSPYLPNSSFYGNCIYIDVPSTKDFQSSAWATKCLASAEIQERLRDLRNSKYVEYEKVYKLKKAFLKFAFRQFLREYRLGSARAEQFRQFVTTEGEMLDLYAVYSALEETLHRRDPNMWIWPDWPAQFKDPRSGEVAEFASTHARLVLFYKYMQWQYDLQLKAAQAHAVQLQLSIGLYHDLALATDRCGSDLWAHKPFYVQGCRVGSPPDDFSPLGQDWAFPPPNSMRHRSNGYQMFADSIRKNCKHGGALRIDHVMRFFRLYWIPEDKSATEGVFVHDLSEDLLRILALESVRQKVIVIGEDLGTVEPYIRESLRKFCVLSYRLLYFEKHANGTFKLPDEYPKQALVSVTTHDLPTLAGFWTSRDIEIRLKAGVITDEGSYRESLRHRAAEKQIMLDMFHTLKLLPLSYEKKADKIPEFSGELHNAAVNFLASTPSMLLVLNQEDLFKDPDQQNLPGTTEQYPNWRHKMRFTLEELTTDPFAIGCTAMFKGSLRKYGRLDKRERASN